MLNSDVLECLLSFLSGHKGIQLEEGLLERLLIIPALKSFALFDNFRQVFSTELGDLNPAMSIEDSKEKCLLVDAMEDQCIFHVLAPP